MFADEVEDAVHVDRPRRLFGVAREDLEVAHDRPDAVSAPLARLRERALRLGVGHGLLDETRGSRSRTRADFANLVRDARRERPERREPLRLGRDRVQPPPIDVEQRPLDRETSTS